MSKQDLFDLSGKVALITGASRGIGESIARTLANYGAHVIVSSRKIDGCEAVASSIREAGGSAEAYACPQELRRDSGVKRHAPGNLVDVYAELLADVAYVVYEADFRCQEGVGGILNHLGGFGVCYHYRALEAPV